MWVLPDTYQSFGWDMQKIEMPAVDWHDGGATVCSLDTSFEAFVSPYSPGCSVEEQLVCISTIKKLREQNLNGKIVLLHGDIAKEQLMPKNFVFYNPREHQEIISLLESKNVKAIISATGRNAALAGGVYPFPLIEDGDFDIPSVYMTEDEGEKLLLHEGKPIKIVSNSKRIPGKCYNIIATKGKDQTKKIVITAHIDAKKGSPGAIDNATGVIVLLLLAQELKNYNGNNQIELVPLNGEDYYAVPGQMDYIRMNQDKFDNIILNINIDGAGYKEGKSAFSLFDLPENLKVKVSGILNDCQRIVEGEQWPQGDHSIFVQNNCPAIAVTSKWFLDNIDTQTITHTPKDNPDIVDCSNLVDITETIVKIISC
ncbi:MAG: Zn-dependent exopeptidase M28 [Fibrobacter sp.]|nr:Zn-dependent exopeptidase M28 [Fibrobacter sp.]